MVLTGAQKWHYLIDTYWCSKNHYLIGTPWCSKMKKERMNEKGEWEKRKKIFKNLTVSGGMCTKMTFNNPGGHSGGS